MGPDTLVIFLIILLLFGRKRLSEFGQGLGFAIREFKKGKDDFADDDALRRLDWFAIVMAILLTALVVLAMLNR